MRVIKHDLQIFMYKHDRYDCKCKDMKISYFGTKGGIYALIVIFFYETIL